MTLLSERVQKSRKLRITKTNGNYNTWGSNDDRYVITLSSTKKDIVTPDGWLIIPVFYTDCKKVVWDSDKLDATLVHCKGNTSHTVCYHCLGAIWKSFKDAGRKVSFFQSYHDAIIGLQFGGFLAKVENNNGKGYVWAVVRKPGEKRQNMNFETMKEFE